MFYNLAGNNATYFEDRIDVIIALCPFWVQGELIFLNKMMGLWSWYIEPLFNPTFKFYRMNPYDNLHHWVVGYGCAYYPLKYICDIVVTNMATATNEFTNTERERVFFGHYPSGSSVRCWQHFIL